MGQIYVSYDKRRREYVRRSRFPMMNGGSSRKVIFMENLSGTPCNVVTQLQVLEVLKTISERSQQYICTVNTLRMYSLLVYVVYMQYAEDPKTRDGALVSTQEAKYVERWPSTTSAWAGWSRFDIPVDRYGGVHSLLQWPSRTLGSSTCHQASQQVNTY